MPARSKIARRLALLALGLTIMAVAATRASAASCDATGADAAAVASARAAVQAACDCDGAERASAWGRCVRSTLRTLLGSGLSRACERHVRRTELRSTCGRPGRSVCCRTSRSGKTTASLRRSGFCSAPSGGSSCESIFEYLDEACRPGGCKVPICGNGIVEPGEACDPPDALTCGDTCATCPGDEGCWEPGQKRFCGDGPVTPQCSIALSPRATCEAEGGCWDVTPFHPEGLCNCPTLDAGKPCQAPEDCDGLCLKPEASCGVPGTGTCSETKMVYSCVCLAFAPGGFYILCID